MYLTSQITLYATTFVKDGRPTYCHYIYDFINDTYLETYKYLAKITVVISWVSVVYSTSYYCRHKNHFLRVKNVYVH